MSQPSQLIDFSTCPECHSAEIISDVKRGEIACIHCGLILDSNIIDPRAEWRAFNLQDFTRKSRTGSPISMTLHDKGLSTMIDWRDRDAFGKKLSPARRTQAYRLRKWQIRMRVHSSLDRNLAFAMSELDRLCSQMILSNSVKESAALLYRQTVKRNLIRGRSIESMLGASIYASCRIHKIPRTLEDFALNSRINKRGLGRCFRLILRELNIQIPSASPNRFISKFANDLNVSTNAQVKAIRILNVARRIGLTSGRDPVGLAAASLYIVSLQNGLGKTQKEIAQIACITEVTVRNRYKELVRCLHLRTEPTL